MKVEIYIRELLFRHDCVILNNLGGFISHYRSAQIHPISHRFLPPSKSIRFNTQLDKNDGLLAHYIADCESISFEAAQTKVDKFVERIKNDLEHKREAKIQNIGLLSLDLNGHISFEASLNDNFLLDSFGMESIQSPAILRKKEKGILKREITRKAKNLQKKSLNLNWKVAAILLPLIAISSIVSVQNETLREYYSNYAFLNPFKTKPVAVYIPRITSEEEKIITTPTEILKDIIPDSKKRLLVEETFPVYKQTKNEITKKIPTSIVNYSKTYTKFHLVAGCFSSKKNAINLSIKLKLEGFKADMIGQSEQGLYRVAYATFSEKELAINQLSILKKSGKATWLLKQ